MITSRQIWKDVFEGHVKKAVEATREYREKHLKKEVDPGKDDSRVAIYLEPSLTSLRGHQLKLARSYELLLKETGFRTIFFHAFENDLPPQRDWIPYFKVLHHTMHYQAINSRQDLERVESYYAEEFGETIDAYDPHLCVFGTIRFTNIVAAAAAVTNNRGRKNKCKAILGVLEESNVPDCTDKDIVQSAFSRAASKFINSGNEYLVIAETEYVRNFLIECGFRQEDVKTYPYVGAQHINTTVKKNNIGSNKIQIGYVGGTRKERNPELIADILISNELPELLHWKVQLDLNYLKKVRGDDAVEKIQDLNSGGTIAHYSPGLAEEVYVSLFNSLDFVVLPYSDKYQKIGSGILIEAIYLEVVPILPIESSMNRLYSSLGGNAPSFNELSSASIKSAIEDGCNRYTELKQTAALVLDNWNKHPFSATQWKKHLAVWLGQDIGQH